MILPIRHSRKSQQLIQSLSLPFSHQVFTQVPTIVYNSNQQVVGSSKSSDTTTPSDTPCDMSAFPFCCNEAFSPSFQHLARLMPSTSTHNVLQPPLSAAPLVTSFMSFLLTATHIEPALLPGTPRNYNTRFYAIIQVTTLRSQASPYGGASQTREKTQYFAPIEARNQDTILAPKTSVKNREWREILKEDAQERLRFLKQGVTIGEGEIWKELPGVEKLWCEKHQLFFEMKAWVRDN